MAKKKRTGSVIGLCIFLIVAVIAVLFSFVVMQQLEKLPILPNIKVAGVDVGGMTVDQAANAVKAQIGNDYTAKDITLQIFDEVVTIPAALAGGEPNIEKAVRAARNYGQVGFPSQIQREKEIAASTGYTINLEPYMQLNKSSILQLINNVKNKYNSELTQSTWSVKGNKPTLEDLAAGTVDLQLTVNIGTAKYNIDTDVIYNQIVNAYSNRVFSVVANCSANNPDPVDVDTILSEHQIAAQDAYWDTKTYKVVEAVHGLGFDAEEAKELLSKAEFGSTVTIPFVKTEPAITTEQLQDRMFRDTLSTFTAESDSDSGRKNNLKLACAAVNGIVLNPGETFDYNDTLGQRTRANGYREANAYVNGETVKTVGGGICQVSSTIYYCALMADLEIVTRRNHSYPSSYIPLGMDATVSWGGPEFRFRNNTDYPIKIVASASGGDTTVSIMSYDDRDYYVKMEYEVLKKTSYSVVYKTFPADNPEGYKNGQVISTPYTGYVVDTYRVKYSKETNEEISRTYEARSTYKHRDKVIAKVEAAAPSEPTPSIPSGSDILDQIR